MDRMWLNDEIELFENAILAHGAELRAVRDNVATRSIPEVVRFYGHWKKYFLARVSLSFLTPKL